MDGQTDGQVGLVGEWKDRQTDTTRGKIISNHGKIALPLICYIPGLSLLNDVLCNIFIHLLGIPL